MTVTSTAVREGPLFPNGVTTVFPFSFEAASSAEVSVDIDGFAVPSSRYTVTLSDTGAGAVVFFAPPVGGSMFINSDPAFDQQTAINNQGPYFQRTIEKVLDRFAIRALWLRDRVLRSILVPRGEVGFTLPPASQRIGYAAWSNGGLVSAPLNIPASGANITLLVASRLLLAALPFPVAGTIAYLSEGARAGFWECRNGNAPFVDDLQGLVLQSATPGRHWARVWDGINGKPEWFGALPDNPGFDCVPAIAACIAFCPVTILSAGTYWTFQTLVIDTDNREVRGVGASIEKSLIKLTGARCAAGDTVLRVGRASAPADVYGCVDRVRLDGFGLAREWGGFFAPPPVNDKIVDCDKGLVASWCYNLRVTKVKSYGSRIGFQAFGCVSTDFVECEWNGHNGVTAMVAKDYRVGYLMGGDHRELGFAGANASLRIFRCGGVTTGGVNATGLLLWGYPVDTFVDDFEAAGLPYQIVIDGTDLSGSNGDPFDRGVPITDPGAHQDIRIHRSTLDGCPGVALLVTNTNSSGMILLQDTYSAVTGSGAGILLHKSSSQVVVTGGQMIGGAGSFGFKAEQSINFSVTQLEVRNCGFPVYVDACKAFNIEALIANPSVTADSAAVILVGATSAGRVTANIAGTPGKFSAGVGLANTVARCEINPTCFDTAAFITPTAAFKVRWNITEDARSSSAFATAGNVLTGVTG